MTSFFATCHGRETAEQNCPFCSILSRAAASVATADQALSMAGGVRGAGAWNETDAIGSVGENGVMGPLIPDRQRSQWRSCRRIFHENLRLHVPTQLIRGQEASIPGLAGDRHHSTPFIEQQRHRLA